MARKTGSRKSTKQPNSLVVEFQRVISIFSGLTVNFTILRFCESDLTEIERRSGLGHILMQEFERNLCSAFARIKQPEDYQAVAAAYTIYAEARVSLAFEARGISLERTPGTGAKNQKRPDFVFQNGATKLYFEVKCLDFQGGERRHKAIANAALEVQANMKEVATNGTRTVFMGDSMSISAYDDPNDTVGRIETVIGKVFQNVDREQITYGPTILVIEMSRISLIADDSYCLAPVYYEDGDRGPCCVSGELWHIALGKCGEQIYKIPDSLGMSNLDRCLRKNGVLRDFPELLGVTFLFPNTPTATKVFTIKNLDPTPISNKSKDNISPNVVENIIDNYSDAWNDSVNSRGHMYSVSD